MANYRWTVRGMDTGSLEKLREIKEINGTCFGELLAEAIDDWYEHLPEEADDEEAITLIKELQDDYSPGVDAP